VCSENTNRFATLDQKRFVALEAAQCCDDLLEIRPRTRGLSAPAVDDEFIRRFCDLWIEVVHEHAKGGFLMPSLTA
jgi:hypothetical protein